MTSSLCFTIRLGSGGRVMNSTPLVVMLLVVLATTAVATPQTGKIIFPENPPKRQDVAASSRTGKSIKSTMRFPEETNKKEEKNFALAPTYSESQLLFPDEKTRTKPPEPPPTKLLEPPPTKPQALFPHNTTQYKLAFEAEERKLLSPGRRKNDFLSEPRELLTRTPRGLHRRRQHQRRPPGRTRRFFLGDQSRCSIGTCEFFLMCWLRGGVIKSGCGGFLFACCQRDRRVAQDNSLTVTSAEDNQHSAVVLPEILGPVYNDPYCGIPGRVGAQRRIVGGSDAGFGVFPWQAYIRVGSSRCGGSLINSQHLVTAGHCVARAKPRQVVVTLGDYILNSNAEPLRATKMGVIDIQVHPNFKFTPQADRFDVAVLTLDRPVRYEPHISPICLPDKDEVFLGETAWAAGWGALQAGSRLRPKTLQVVDVPVMANSQCERWHKNKGINVNIYGEMICAGHRNGGKDSCQGDSGGPLMAQRRGKWFLIGLVSAGYSCAQSGQPGIYHRIANTADWISAVANS